MNGNLSKQRAEAWKKIWTIMEEEFGMSPKERDALPVNNGDSTRVEELRDAIVEWGNMDKRVFARKIMDTMEEL